MLVLEPALPGGAVKTARKGCGEFELTVRGVAAHAGIEPEKGASAMLELAEQLLAIDRLQDRRARARRVNPGLVCGRNAGERRAGRGARDDRRAGLVTRAEADAPRDRPAALCPTDPGTSLTGSGGFDRPPFERTKDVARLFGDAQAVAPDWASSWREGATGGGSDGNFTAARGVSTLDGSGAEGDGAHAAHEHVLVDRLAPRAALVAGLIARLGGREA